MNGVFLDIKDNALLMYRISSQESSSLKLAAQVRLSYLVVIEDLIGRVIELVLSHG